MSSLGLTFAQDVMFIFTRPAAPTPPGAIELPPLDEMEPLLLPVMLPAFTHTDPPEPSVESE